MPFGINTFYEFGFQTLRNQLCRIRQQSLPKSEGNQCHERFFLCRKTYYQSTAAKVFVSEAIGLRNAQLPKQIFLIIEYLMWVLFDCIEFYCAKKQQKMFNKLSNFKQSIVCMHGRFCHMAIKNQPIIPALFDIVYFIRARM